ncbi:MAG TPA: hypothetical protein VGZ00_09180 [Candidatus Baltobacteraceae bacterium]|jgi:hypothetical protein|nr:hypothetical protein [Candidatus Baltobacteraceae bacterium]
MIPDATYPALTAAWNTVDLAFRETKGASAYEYASLSAATLRAYAESWADFKAWTTQRGLPSLPATPETVGRYLADCILAEANVAKMLALTEGRNYALIGGPFHCSPNPNYSTVG